MNTMNSTGNDSCVLLEKFVVFPPTCPSSIIENYKAISLSFALAFGTMVILHARNLAVTVVNNDFQVSLNNSSMIINLLLMLVALSCMVVFSNNENYHHADGCIGTLAADLRTSFVILAM